MHPNGVPGRLFKLSMTAIALLLLVLTAASCFGKLSLENYLSNLDEIRERSENTFAAIESSLESLAGGPDAINSLYGDVSKAQSDLEVSEKELLELKPPSQAEELHSLVLALYAESTGFFSDMKSMLEYSVKREPLIAEFEAVSSDLDARTAADPSPQSVGRALADSSARAKGIAAELGKLSPPQFLEGVQKALLEMLGSYSSSLLELELAIESSDVSAVNAAQQKVRESLAGNLAEETGKSIEVYNGRIERIEKLREQANAEETRITGS